MAAGVIIGKLAVVKQAGKALVLEIAGHQVAAFGEWLQERARSMEHQNVIATVEVSAKEGSNRFFTSLRLTSISPAQDGYETSTVAGTGYVEAVRKFGKNSSEAVLSNGESKVLITSKDDLEPLIGQTVGFRGYLQSRNGFTNLVVTEVKPISAQAHEMEELPF